MTSPQMTFRVPDMSCAHCVNTIRSAIETAIEGSRVEADLASRIVTVTGTNDGDKIAAIIMTQDYSFEPL